MNQKKKEPLNIIHPSVWQTFIYLLTQYGSTKMRYVRLCTELNIISHSQLALGVGVKALGPVVAWPFFCEMKNPSQPPKFTSIQTIWPPHVQLSPLDKIFLLQLCLGVRNKTNLHHLSQLFLSFPFPMHSSIMKKYSFNYNCGNNYGYGVMWLSYHQILVGAIKYPLN